MNRHQKQVWYIASLVHYLPLWDLCNVDLVEGLQSHFYTGRLTQTSHNENGFTCYFSIHLFDIICYR